MEALVLGIGGMMPMPGRWLTSVALLFNGRATLFDCGEGTQVPLKKSGFGIGRFERFALTHLHADHLTGIPGLMMLLAQAEPEQDVEILGLPDVNRYVRTTRELLRFYLGYQLKYTDLNISGGTIKGDGFSLHYAPLSHSTPILGYAFEEDPRPGRFSVEKARALEIPEGPAWGMLQRGESVEINGQRYQPEDVLGPARRGRKFAFITDTTPCEGAAQLLQGADLAVIEAMFCEEHADEAVQKMHLTAKQAAELVRDGGCGRALLVHVSPRYRSEELRRLEEEARTVYDRVELAIPLERYVVPLPD